jgi:hypothetical protein
VVTQKTRDEDDRIREELRNADIEKFKRALKPLMPIIAPVKKKESKEIKNNSG